MAVLSEQDKELMESNTAEELGNCFLGCMKLWMLLKWVELIQQPGYAHDQKLYRQQLIRDIKLDDVARHVHMSPVI